MGISGSTADGFTSTWGHALGLEPRRHVVLPPARQLHAKGQRRRPGCGLAGCCGVTCRHGRGGLAAAVCVLFIALCTAAPWTQGRVEQPAMVGHMLLQPPTPAVWPPCSTQCAGQLKVHSTGAAPAEAKGRCDGLRCLSRCSMRCLCRFVGLRRGEQVADCEGLTHGTTLDVQTVAEVPDRERGPQGAYHVHFRLLWLQPMTARTFSVHDLQRLLT